VLAGRPRPSYDRALWALRTRLDSWSGIGHLAVGMHRQGYDHRATTSSWRSTTSAGGVRPSTRQAWSTHRRARPAPRGSGAVASDAARCMGGIAEGEW